MNIFIVIFILAIEYNGLAMISAWNRPQDYSAEKSS